MVVASLTFGGDFNLDPGLVVTLVVALVVALVVTFLTLVFVRLVALVDLVVDALFLFSFVGIATVVRRLRRVPILLSVCFEM